MLLNTLSLSSAVAISTFTFTFSTINQAIPSPIAPQQPTDTQAPGEFVLSQTTCTSNLGLQFAKPTTASAPFSTPRPQ
jgi:hypothetical protein